jgi:hypothetical protein
MNLQKIILLSIVLIQLVGCRRSSNDVNFESDVIHDVFLEVVDSIYMDRRVMLPPKPPRYDNKTTAKDTIGYSKILAKYYSRQDSILNDKSKIKLVVDDYVEKITANDNIAITKLFNDLAIEFDNFQDSNHFRLDLSKYSRNKKFNFRYASEFPQESYWDISIDSDLPVGAISISRIQFNRDRTMGVFPASASCGGGKCGRGFLILIKKKNNNWRIAKIIDTWVS